MASAQLDVTLNLTPVVTALEILKRHAEAAIEEIRALTPEDVPPVELPAAQVGETDG